MFRKKIPNLHVKSLAVMSGLVLTTNAAIADQICSANGLTAYQGGNFKRAAALIQPCAQQGDPAAQLTLGTLYRTGLGVSKDLVKAAHWYQKAAEQGLPEAQFNLGMMYANGDGVTEDEYKALDWIYRAAEQGHENARVVFRVMINQDFAVGC
jgi:TPR repeat protein